MLLRIIAAVMFTCAGAMAGITFSERLKDNREICREIGEILRISAIGIRCGGLNVYELSAELKGRSDLKNLSFLNDIPDSYMYGENFHELWRKSVNSQQGLLEEERRLLCKFGDILGTSDIDGQLTSIAAIEEELERLQHEREESYRQKGRLYRSVGMLFGVMAGVLVI